MRVENYDFALFLLTPDDAIESRGEKQKSARDNVFFEAGLFLSALGRERVEILVQNEQAKPDKVKIPSDLSGVILPRFTADSSIASLATLNNALSNFRDRIRRLGRFIRPIKLVESWGFDLESKKFSMNLSAELLRQNAHRLIGRRFILVARKEDPDKDAQDDLAIAISTLRRPPLAGQALRIAAGPDHLNTAVEGSVVEGYLFWVPDSFDITTPKTIEQLLAAGALLIESKAVRASVVRHADCRL